MLSTLFAPARWLRRAGQQTVGAEHGDSDSNWLVPANGHELLSAPHRKQLLRQIWDVVSVSHDAYRVLMLQPLQRYANLVQQLPASESHHHSYAGGMLDHALQVVIYALRLRRQHLLPPGASPEAQSSAGERWTIAIAYGALLHDAAKVLVDVEITLRDGRRWSLLQGDIPGPYRVQYRRGRDYRLHQVTNGLLCQRVIGADALNWLSEDPDVFAQLMYAITGYEHEAGIIGEIVARADRSSVAKALGGDPSRAFQAPTTSLQRKLAEAMRYIVREQLQSKLNTPRSPAYLTHDALWLVAPAVPNQVKAHLLHNGVSGVPSQTTRLYDEMQAHGLIQDTDGKAIHKATVAIGEWSADLSFIRVPPQLIWPGDDRPAPLDGTLTVVGAVDAEEKESASAPSNEKAPAAPAAPNSASEPGKPEANASSEDAASTPSQSAGNDDMADMIALLTGGASSPVAPKESEKSSTKVVTPKAGDGVESADQKPVVAEEEGKAQAQEDPGQAFLTWLRTGLAEGTLIVNETKALIHVVDGRYFLVSPRIFKRFAHQTMGDESAWESVQKRWERLKLHDCPEPGRNLHQVSVQGPNRKGRTLSGYLLKSSSHVTPRLPDNRHLTLLTEPATNKENAS
ncbi:MobH family relaxase [Billgrantia desiderata]|uniref:MobH family relaxase n=1 Tax=Billgrantia desiderata TaxID=52021 RepID=UPI001F3E8CAD|nr:DNA-binding domain-containing protein [Halomonas desiderata]